jgi:hypothetical protein
MHLEFSVEALQESVDENQEVQHIHPHFNEELHPGYIGRNEHGTIG